MANEAELRRIVSLIDASPLEKRDPKDLLPYAQNSRTHSEYQIKQIADSIIEFGFTNPVLIDEKDEVIAGHGRIFAAMKLELPKVPVIVMSHLSPTQKKAYVIADNKLALNAGWDLDLLKLQLNELDNEQFDLTLTGFDDIELDTLLGEVIPANEGNTDPDAIPEVKETRCKPGDLWQLGNHRLLCGDSTNSQHVDRLTNGAIPILMITDPPYGVNLDQSWRDEARSNALGKGNKNKITNDDRASWPEVYSLFQGNIAYVWHDACQTEVVKKDLEDCGFDVRQMIVWNKSIMVIGRSAYHWKHEPCWYAVRKNKDANWKGDRKQTTVWDAASPNHIMSGSKEDKTEHPSQKPAVLSEIPIINHTVSGDGVYDPFLGSGSTLIACEKTGRKCYGMEIDPHYCGVILARWEQFTGQTAVLVED